jgi:tetratricopeptide (TPR) repeat protein
MEPRDGPAGARPRSARLAAALLLAAGAAFAQEGPQDPEALWEAGYRQEAVELWTAALERAPEDAALRLRLVRAELAVQRYVAALEHLEPLGDAARGERGRALFFLGRYEEALEFLDPDAAEETLLFADALESLGRFDGTDGADAAVDRAARALGAEHPDVLLLTARRHERHGRWPEAAAVYRKVLEADPLERAALFGLGQALLSCGEEAEGRAVLERHRELLPLLDQLDDARRRVDLAPHHGPNHAAVGDAERALGRIDAAERAYRTALERTTDEQCVPIALRLARLLREDRQSVDRAVALLAEVSARPAAKLDPRPAVRAGDYLMEVGRAFEALQHYLQAEARAPTDPEVRARVELARQAAGR